MQGSLDALEAAGLRLVAISVDPPEVSREFTREAGYSFMFLSDPGFETIRRYDLVDEVQNVARPAEFLLDSAGIVRWRMLTGAYYVRARPEQILEAAKALP